MVGASEELNFNFVSFDLLKFKWPQVAVSPLDNIVIK